MHMRLARWIPSLVLLAGAVAVNLSPLHLHRAQSAWSAVALGALLGLGILWRYKARVFRLVQLVLGPAAPVTHPRTRLSPTDLAILATIASATTQALVAIDLPSPQYLPIHETPGADALYLFLAGGLSFISAITAATQADRGRAWSAILAACVFSSNLYLRAFATPEAGPVYGSVFGFALLAASTLWNSSLAHGRAPLRHQPDRLFALTGMVFLACVALAALFSPVPRQSLNFWLRWASLLALAAMLSGVIDSRQTWRAVAWGTMIVAGALPVLLACLKFLSLIPSFGLAAALSYRLNPNEFGGANLIACSILCVVPLALALTSHWRQRARRWTSLAVIVSCALAMLYARSWEGFFALLISLGVYGIGVYWQGTQKLRRRLTASPLVRGVAVAGVVIVAVPFTVFSIQAARQLNVYSFNGRLIHWHGALLAWRDHVWVGGGPGNEILYLPYADQVGLVVDTQVTVDAPLDVIRVETGRSLQAHAHNLVLGLGATTGLLGVLAFGSLIASIAVVGLQAWHHSSGIVRSWVAGCLAGITGALAWGMLDVLWVTPPFFSFPVWALIGLLLAACCFDRADARKQMPESADEAVPGRHWWSILFPWFLAALALLTVLRPALASVYYASGFSAFQEQRWSESALHLRTATQHGRLDPQPQQLLADAYLALKDMERAEQVYQQAANLQRDFSPYLVQLGWLAWLKGDLEEATGYFERAVERDPAEIGRYGLHAALGIAHAAQGNSKEAIGMLADAIELYPASAVALPWVRVIGDSYTPTTVLDPAYLHGPSPELDKRILAHLGAPDYTERIFAPTEALSSPIALADVLDAVEADYRQAAAEGRRDAPLLLAALAEASRLAGLDARAEQAYLEFQALQPNSAYGFRDLGVLYQDQGRLEEAQAALERAIAVSPRDVDSRYRLALVYMDREMWGEAEQALATITSQSLTTLFRSRLFDPNLYIAASRIHLAQGDVNGAIEARARAAAIRDLPADHLALAKLYRQAGETDRATKACIAAADALFPTWPRPLDPLLWDIGICLAQAPDDDVPDPITAIARRHPLPGNVLLGHLYRARSQHELALTAYQDAAEARPDQGAPHYFLGETYQALGQPDRAEAEYRRAAELDPLESLPLLALGRMQWTQGWHDKALDTFREAVEVTPGWGEAQVELGNALLAAGDLAGATRHYHLALLADRDVTSRLAYDLTAELAGAEIESPGPEYVRGTYVTIDGKRQRALFMHPDSRVRYAVEVPAGGELAFDVATMPESWSQPGDGVGFCVYVESSAGIRQVFSTYIDPKQRDADRRWHAFIVDLDDYSGQAVTLILEMNAGPAGDIAHDWAIWSNLRLIKP